MSENNTIISIGPENAGKRLDVCLKDLFPDHSRSFFSNLIARGLISVNGKSKKDSYKVSAGDSISVVFPEVKEVDLQAQNIPLDILYEDDDVLVVNKPKGMVVHPAPGHEDNTLVNAILYHCGNSLSGINGEKRPGIVHRIDRDTTGSLIICKNDKAHNAIAAQIKEHTVNRIYEGIIIGNLKNNEGTIDAPLARSKNDRKKVTIDPAGRRAVTHYRVLERFGDYTYCEFRLETGRTHQIRVHMASIGHPLLGDPVYGPRKCPFKLEGQTLHAKTIGFIHPTTGQYVEVSAPLPEYFEKLLEKIRRGPAG